MGTTFTHRLLRLALCCLLLGCAFLCGSFPGTGFARTAFARTPGDSDPQGNTYRSTVTEISITFSATDQNHHGVTTLQAGDFAVVDTDVIVRNFRSFHRIEMTRLDVAVLIDASQSIAPRFRQEMANVVQLVAQTDDVPDESFSVASFRGQKPSLICAGNCRATHAADRIVAMPEGGLTPLFDSVVFAADLLSQWADPHAKKILILFSDGDDTISRSSAADAVQAALAAEVQIYTVNLGGAPGSSGGTSTLRSLAHATGGRSFAIQEGAAQVIDSVLEDFHATYVVIYKPPTRAAGFHEVRILPTHNLNLQFRCRGGYFYPDNVR